jgi:glycosyltransferase involved in cell wall biosynthesis
MNGSTRSYEQAKFLVQRGHHVTMITSDRSGNAKRTINNCVDGISVFWIPVKYSNNMSFLRRIISFVRFSIFASYYSATIKSDIILASSTPLTIIIPAVVSKYINKSKLLFEVRDLWPALPVAMGALKNKFTIGMASWLERFAYSKSDSIVALSPGMKQGIVDVGVNPDKITVIPNACDLELFHHYTEPQFPETLISILQWVKMKPVVLYTGTFGYMNDLSYVVNLAYELRKKKSDIQFILVGDGVEYQKISDLALDKGLLGVNFHVHSSLPKIMIPALYAKATVAASFVAPIKVAEANSANKFFDALAAGKPVLVNHGGWLSKMINEFECGITLHGLDFSKSACHLMDVLNNQSELYKLQINAKKLALQFDRNVLCSTLELKILDCINNIS